MLAGDTLAGRFVPQRWREWLGPPLRLLLAAPYLIFAAATRRCHSLRQPSRSPRSATAASLLLQQRLMSLTPDELSGHALGLHSSGMLAMQGVGAVVAGVIAQLTSPATAMAPDGSDLLAVTLALALALRPGRKPRPAR